MTTMDLERKVALLSDVLRQHFSAISEDEALHEARELLSGLSISEALEDLENSDVDPEEDRERLRLAAKSLANAHKHLSKVGRRGRKCFTSALVQLSGPTDHSSARQTVNAKSAQEAVVAKLSALSMFFKKAANDVDLLGRPLGAEFSNTQRGRREKLKALYFSNACAALYYKQPALNLPLQPQHMQGVTPQTGRSSI